MKKSSSIVTKIIKWVAGSWWGVALHTTWFAFWLISDFNLNILTMAVSLEAIFIGIFLLIASNESEASRDRREIAAQKRGNDIIEKILDLEHRIEKQQQQILKILVDNQEKD